MPNQVPAIRAPLVEPLLTTAKSPSVRCSTRTLFDGTPAELWFVEDSMGWKRIAVRQVGPPAGARIYTAAHELGYTII